MPYVQEFARQKLVEDVSESQGIDVAKVVEKVNNSKTDTTWNWMFKLQFVVMLIAMTPVFIMLFYSLKWDKVTQRVQQHGERTSAKVVDLWYSGMKVNNKALINITVEILWEPRLIKHAPADTALKVRVWDKIYVKYNPDNPNEVILDGWE